MHQIPDHLKKGLEDLIKDSQVTAIFCHQWGDSGKGKFDDLLAFLVDINARGTGGSNAGHTVVINNKEYIFHLIPSAILHDTDGKYNIIGKGVVIDPRVFVEEINTLELENLTYNNLMLSYQANVITPHDIILDKLEGYLKGKGRIGTTGRGVGPAYANYVSRNAIFIDDLFNKDIFTDKIKERSNFLRALLSSVDREELKKKFNHPHLLNGAYYNEKKLFDDNAIIEIYQKLSKQFKDLVTDTEGFIKKSLKQGKKILLEGAQGTLLSIDYGTYPFTTSSDASVRGLAKGVGLNEEDLDLKLGIVKAPYMTRVGNGPFPTEFGGRKSERYCDKGLEHDIFYEAACYLGVDEKIIKRRDEEELKKAIKNKSDKIVKLINSNDPFERGVGIRLAGYEYGATTKRPRRTGKLDLRVLKYTIDVNNSRDIILTKMDVMDMAEKIELCIGYVYQGPDVTFQGKLLTKGTEMTTFPRQSHILYHCEPKYIEVSGWQTDTSNLRDYRDAPPEFKNTVNKIMEITGTNVRMISVGADREKTIIKN